MKKILLPALSVFAVSPWLARAQKPVTLRAESFVSLHIPEPSDICTNPGTDHFFIVSDNGMLFEIDRDGSVLKKSKEFKVDFEAVFCEGETVYAVDETRRTIFFLDRNSLELQRKLTIPYSGARNKGYEAMAWNQAKQRFVLITEKDPALLLELDANFNVVNTVDISGLARDVSAASWHDGFLWLLSDEDMTLFKLDPQRYSVVSKWRLPVINPEGFAFAQDGKLLVTCDDMQRLYYFPNPDQP